MKTITIFLILLISGFLLISKSIAQPCNSNVDCISAIAIPIPNAAELVCITGCTVGMPAQPFCGSSGNPSAWYSFNTGPNNTAVFDLNSTELSSPVFVIMSSCKTVVECNPSIINLQANTTYYVLVSDLEGNVGDFDLCITLLSITAPCIKEETFTITGASMGSPLEGPFKPCEVITFRYSTNFFAGGGCQWIHSFVPYFSDCWQNAVPQIIPPYPAGSNSGNLAWYPQGTTEWKPLTNNPHSAIGINSDGKFCLIGTPDCSPFVGGGQCGIPGGGTPMPAGWVSTTTSGTCGGNAPNTSWGITQGCNSSSVKILTFTIQVPCDACTSCDDDPEGFVIGMASFPDGATGGYSSPQCNGNGLLKKNVLVKCCKPPNINLVSGQACSNNTYFADITLDPVNSTLIWTVVSTNGVTGATSGSGDTFSQTLTNPTSISKIVTYSIIPVSPTGCSGDPQLFMLTVLPAFEVNISPDSAAFCFADRFNHALTANANGTNTPFTYAWDTPWGNPTNQTITILAPFAGTYQIRVEVKDAIGCLSLGLLDLTLHPDPSVLMLDVPTAPLCPTEPYRVSSSPLYLDGTVFSSVPQGLITVDGTI